ncbi:unnamed protein product, partial [Rotaria sp. Silwood2]
SFMQWPLPPLESSSQIASNLTTQSINNQLDELKKKMTHVQQVIISLRPKKKTPLFEHLPNFEYDNEVDTIDNDIQSSSLFETYEIENQESLSEQIYKEIDGQTTRMYSRQIIIDHGQVTELISNVLVFSI